MSVAFLGNTGAALPVQGSAPIGAEPVVAQAGPNVSQLAAPVSVQTLLSHWQEAAEAENLPMEVSADAVAIDAQLQASAPRFEDPVDTEAAAMSAWPSAAAVWTQLHPHRDVPEGVFKANQALTAKALPVADKAPWLDSAPVALPALPAMKPGVQPLGPVVRDDADNVAVTLLARSAQPGLSAPAPMPPGVEPLSVPVHKGVQPLLQALGQRIQLQQVQGAEVATVRLDPPQMGSLEIRIRQEGAGVQVHIQASHAEVGRQLNMLVESLRQELQQRNSEASVTVAQGRATAGGGQGDQSRREQAPAPSDSEIGLALQAWGNESLT